MKNYKIARNKDHRTLLVKNLTTSLIIYERVNTTLAKAKLAQRNFERLMEKTKKLDTVNTVRLLSSQLTAKEAVKKMVEVLKQRFKKINGGYTRLIKTGPRRGDGAEMVLLELIIKTEFEKKEVRSGVKLGKDKIEEDATTIEVDKVNR